MWNMAEMTIRNSKRVLENLKVEKHGPSRDIMSFCWINDERNTRLANIGP